MSAQQNKQAAQDAYAAFGNRHAEGEMWGKLMSKDFRTTPHDFVAEGDKVVVLTTRELGGEATEGADVLTFNADGKLITFEALGDTEQIDRVFAK
jgi:hypothetical protein